jgi:hypothetical protein
MIEYSKKDCSLVESFILPRAKYIGNADTMLRQKPAAQAQHETKTSPGYGNYAVLPFSWSKRQGLE